MSDFESILAQYQPGTLLEVLRDCGWFSHEQSVFREQLNLGEWLLFTSVNLLRVLVIL